ncbi:MAG: MATE family efflux transporter, partial [Alphaproteobacteria bacterium]|nr:MATE family efflux transporter [Alphaproteobacteria bacterium]
AAVRVGNAMGAGERGDVARRAGLAIGLALAALLPWTAAYLAAPHLLAAPFSDDPAVRTAAVAMIVAMAAFLWADAVQVVSVFALRAAGDQVAAGVIQAVSYFGVMTSLGWLFVHRLDAGPAGIAMAMGLGLATAAVAGVLRLRWLTKSFATAR